MPPTASRHPAYLLLGPTGAGKTPLGNLLAERGLAGRRLLHFDFGDNLRRVVARDQPDATISAEDIAFLRNVLATGALLEDKDFPLAERIFRSFLDQREAGTTPVVLNGLPRHVGQAEAVDRLVEIRAIFSLECDAATVVARIASNVGGDRGERLDDDRQAVARKLEIFRQRTAPLIEYYRARRTPVTSLTITADMTPRDAWQRLEEIVAAPESGV